MLLESHRVGADRFALLPRSGEAPEVAEVVLGDVREVPLLEVSGVLLQVSDAAVGKGVAAAVVVGIAASDWQPLPASARRRRSDPVGRFARFSQIF